ncbi:hypothetical protein Poli38472_010503 [Pythium oligandrum]|uniref:Uncharacterized protein n=1 Tax=Pythium oligandrum TaxID=41045 RepID=A0A8K1FB07_PYTOL|nr:hypothetical protein Poli38472_010503 [Pythium oligandrum]|eukprot:TMW55621.1 hypothetical protein Poli38472_010503 [Pythium oligandrum]
MQRHTNGARTPLTRGSPSHYIGSRGTSSVPVTRDPRGAAPPPQRTSKPPRPRPSWNAYLTDDAQYKLPHDKQLVKQMQQMSTAHFRNRSPGGNRQRAPEEYSASSSRRSSSSDGDYDYSRSSERTNRMEGQRGQQSELSYLENMLANLEAQAEHLDDASVHDHEEESYSHDGESAEDHLDTGTSEYPSYEDDGTEGDGVPNDPLIQICYKSLVIGLDLVEKVRLLTQELEDEREARLEQEDRIKELEEHKRSAELRCEELEVRYDEVSQQVEGMRDAMIATEEAVHRLTRELLRSNIVSKTPVSRSSGTFSTPQRARRDQFGPSPSSTRPKSLGSIGSQYGFAGEPDEYEPRPQETTKRASNGEHDKENRRVTFDLSWDPSESSVSSDD